MVLQRWDPFVEMRRMQENMNRLWRGFYPATDSEEMENWAIPLDVVQDGDNFIVHASIPGVNPEDIDVSIENDVLTIKGHSQMERERKEGNYLMRERRTGTFHRSLRLPDVVDTDKAKPTYQHGVLTITIPRAESKKAKHLKVGVGKALESEQK